MQFLTLIALLPLALAVPAPQANTPCVCEPKVCLLIWPDSCYCANQNKLDCYNKCGGEYPTLQDCTVDPVIPSSGATSAVENSVPEPATAAAAPAS
ncbi:uncharacterized protein K452DRAFT_317368 [Aplosporella prunicola CBS 121167]|uniref:Extracellular membrane protein CFEM domain-containing protein n=1 Tax=Aplosporella prunicola CBS 121167 TaxID=1176127 RepID=A0A6A6BJZ0_9PEZI|nr:uncharacterized protein K452DRAFT_317368 [Aplosporella prunicola CBS 121167]KAF2143137.1 hypothetical protein K452DRAFT_317368 [Aplosporella prunicola CBS 121167]